MADLDLYLIPRLKLLSKVPENATVEGVLLRHVKQLFLSTYNNPSLWAGVSSTFFQTRFNLSGSDESDLLPFFPSFVMNAIPMLYSMAYPNNLEDHLNLVL